jgi:hypothetical protein
MFFLHSHRDSDNHGKGGAIFPASAISDKAVLRRIGSRHVCAICGHVSTHPDPAELRLMAREHAESCAMVTA